MEYKTTGPNPFFNQNVCSCALPCHAKIFHGREEFNYQNYVFQKIMKDTNGSCMEDSWKAALLLSPRAAFDFLTHVATRLFKSLISTLPSSVKFYCLLSLSALSLDSHTLVTYRRMLPSITI